MSEQNKNGGAAFPTLTYDQGAAMNGIGVSVTDHPGMTLRDYFAAKAMQGLLANPGGPIQENGMSGWNWCNCTVEDVADLAWHIADAMLRARGIAPAADPVREAAPELLEACKAVDEWLMEGFADSDADNPAYNEAFRRALRTVRAAIAKATGQEG